jgi:hypothetical protein
MVDHNPSWLDHWRPHKAVVPIPQSEADEVFEMMNARFKSWTGMTLNEYVNRGQAKTK